MKPLQFAHSNIGHDFFSCKERYEQLSGWLRLSKFLSIAAGPGILLILIKINDPALIAIGTLLVGIGVVPLWAWQIFSLVYHWDRQLETSKLLTREGKKLFEKFSSENLETPTNPTEMELLKKRIEDLHDQVVNDGVSVSDEINIFAQQKVMSSCCYHCTNCGQPWKQKSVLSPKSLKILAKSIQQGHHCRSCGQPTSQ